MVDNWYINNHIGSLCLCRFQSAKCSVTNTIPLACADTIIYRFSTQVGLLSLALKLHPYFSTATHILREILLVFPPLLQKTGEIISLFSEAYILTKIGEAMLNLLAPPPPTPWRPPSFQFFSRSSILIFSSSPDISRAKVWIVFTNFLCSVATFTL